MREKNLIMNLQESIKRILREEKKLILLIRRRVPYDVLDGEFNSSLQFATHLFKKNKFMTLERFVFITISSMIDGIHYYIHSTTSEGSHWYDDVFNSLKDYYKEQIDHRYNLLSKV